MFKRFIIALCIVMGVGFLGTAISVPFAVNDVMDIYNTAVGQSEENKKSEVVSTPSRRIDLTAGNSYFAVEVKQSVDDQVRVEYYDNRFYHTNATMTQQADRTTVILEVERDLPVFNISVRTMIETMVSDSRSNNVVLYIPKDVSLYSEGFHGSLYYDSSVEFANKQELAEQEESERNRKQYENYLERTMEINGEINGYRLEVERAKARYMTTGGNENTYDSDYGYTEYLSDLTDAYNRISRSEQSRINAAQKIWSDFDVSAALVKVTQLLEQQKQYDLTDGDLKRMEHQFRAGQVGEAVYETERASLQAKLEEIGQKRDTLQAEYDGLFAAIG